MEINGTWSQSHYLKSKVHKVYLQKYLDIKKDAERGDINRT